MTRNEWNIVERYLAAGSGKSLSRDGSDVYYSNLFDLDFEAAKLAAANILKAQTYSVFPQVGTVRNAILDVVRHFKHQDQAEQLRKWGPPKWGEISDKLKGIVAGIGAMPDDRQPERELKAIEVLRERVAEAGPVAKEVTPVAGADASKDEAPF